MHITFRNSDQNQRNFFMMRSYRSSLTMNSSMCVVLISLAIFSVASSFVIKFNENPIKLSPYTRTKSSPSTSTLSMSLRPDFEFSFEIPKKGIKDIGVAEVKLPPILEKSELVVVRYELPFSLSAEPDKASGQVVVSKDGKVGGEKVGDIFRQTTYWRGNQPGIFDVSKNADNFDLVVKALLTNDLSIVDEIVLVFERPQ